MPGGDRTGPWGMGPRTGRGAGFCAGYAAPGYAMGGGRWAAPGAMGAGGRGWRHWFHATGLPRWARGPAAAEWGYGAPSREQEIETLRDEAAWLKEQLEAIGRRLEELSPD